jgi:hypothetical protein
VQKLLAALSAGLTHKQACLACGISQATLIDWRERYPDLEPRMEAARETARQTALQGIKTAGEKDWRALAEWLKLTFPEHRQGSNINISATAAAQQVGLVCDEETRQRLIALRERITLADRRVKVEALPEPVVKLQANVDAPIDNFAGNDAAAPDGPCSIWSAPAGTKAPSDASPVLPAWLEHEPGPEFEL